MTSILVTATAESTGKTAIALGLAAIARDRGLSVGYMKPKGTRLESVVGKTLDTDPMLAREILDLEAGVADLEPIVYSPTFVEGAMRGREDPDRLAETVRDRFEELSADRDLMVIEGGGRLSTGGVIDLTDPEVADLLDARVLLVSDHDRPGDVDDVLAAANTIGDRLAGVLFNRIDEGTHDDVESDVAPFLEGRGIPVPGVLPRLTELAGTTVGDFAEELGAEVLTDAPTDAYLERLLVGAMGAEASLRYFRRTRNAVVITGGDRSDVHTTALEASGVRCLCLTGGTRPSEAVIGLAEDRGVPILLVDGDTRSTIERADDVIRSGRTRDERTVERMRELLETHADVDALLDDADDPPE
jgi:BioD-like phosphotransacetylase family protein